MASPERERKTQLFRLISGRPDWALVTKTISQAMARTTTVLKAVARLLLTPSIPTFARMDVKAAKTADSKAKTNHITELAPPACRCDPGLFFKTNSVFCLLGNSLRSEAKVFQYVGGGAAAAEYVVYAVAYHGYRALFTQQLTDSAAEAADY